MFKLLVNACLRIDTISLGLCIVLKVRLIVMREIRKMMREIVKMRDKRKLSDVDMIKRERLEE